ncbi:MAG TPA: helix-turn-helix domain-containing protein [Polyangiaceae bacterium]|nr:helix-turn-helix domain-containing protein [Polyangiaceae bacterium]
MKYHSEMAKTEPFADRVKRLREVRSWTQNELAEHADLAPAALSRILTGERDPNMGHLIQLAAALEVSLTELVAGTTASGVVQAWIPRERLEESERGRVGVIRELDVAKSEATARAAEAAALRKSLESVRGRVNELEKERLQSEVELRSARERQNELLELRGRVTDLEAERDWLAAEAQASSKALSECRGESAHYRQVWEETCARSAQLQSDLSTAKNGQLMVGALGLFLGNVLSTPSKKKRS